MKCPNCYYERTDKGLISAGVEEKMRDASGKYDVGDFFKPIDCILMIRDSNKSPDKSPVYIYGCPSCKMVFID
jgi:hypothetical protein